MKTVWAYGDSFVAGDQDIPGRVDAIEEHSNYNRYNISFASHLARKLNAKLINRAISGCSNFVQLDKLWTDASKIKKDDIVIFGLTTAWRDRVTLPHNCPLYFADNRGPGILDRELAKSLTSTAAADLFYILSSIEKIENLFDLKIIKFNLFHDAILESSDKEKLFFNFKNFIGLGIEGNTILDLLTDNWGKSEKRISDHSKWKPPEEYAHLFTRFSHPNIDGHKVIAEWLEDKLKEMNLI